LPAGREAPRVAARVARTRRRADEACSIGWLLAEVERSLHGAVDGPAEARDIVAAVLDVSRHWVTVHRDAPAAPGLVERVLAAAAARARGMPVPYAVRRAAFRHLTLDIDERVLIPRPETEGLVDVVIARATPGGLAIDVGTGSGAIALALAQEGRFTRVIGTDVSTDAIAVATANACRLQGALNAAVEFRTGADLAPVRDVRARAIVSNPPYISWTEAAVLPSSVRDWEPAIALFSGREGTDATAVLIREAGEVLEPGGLLAVEVDARRAAEIARLMAEDGRYTQVVVAADLFGRERYVSALRGTGE
jgi:release factor glutamine methyltransferase